MTLEFANVSDGDGEAEDYGAYFLEDGHGVFSEWIGESVWWDEPRVL